MPYFRNADRDSIYESVRDGVKLIQDVGVGLGAYRAFAGEFGRAVEPEKIRAADTSFELAAIMNDVCPHLAACKDVFQLHARGAFSEFSGINAWGGFVPTMEEPKTVAAIWQDATQYTFLQMLTALDVQPVKAGAPDPLAKARPFLQAEFKRDEIKQIEAQILQLHDLWRFGMVNEFVDMFWNGGTRAAVLQHTLKEATGVESVAKSSAAFSTMAPYNVPIEFPFDAQGTERSRKIVHDTFQKKLKPTVFFGEIAGDHHLSQDGLHYMFTATTDGAKKAADALVPLKVYDAKGQKLAAARIIIS